MAQQQIIAMGGGGFSADLNNLALDRYILEQANRPDPAIAFLATASGDAPTYITRFYQAFSRLGCTPSHLSLFEPHTADLESYIMEQDIIYVGGGNTRSMLALWREWELDIILRDAYEAGVVLAGISAGAICWFYEGTTDSIPGQITQLPCLGLLPHSCSPHYDGELERRPVMQHFIATGDMRPGYGIDNDAALHFIDGELNRGITTRKEATAYFVEREDDRIKETAQDMMLLSPTQF
ncbi:MAG: peptidase E [Chloroflexota bacterium]